MDLRQARTFVAIADLGTVSKAAVQLRIAQPALSRQVAGLERELGVKLFDRVGRRLLLTSVGEQLLSDCRTLLNYGETVRERATLLRKGDSGVLKVAASPQHIESVFAGLLPKYRKSFPGVDVLLREGSGREILEMLERGEIHFAQNLLHELKPDPERFTVRQLGSIDLLAACHRDLKLGTRDTIEVSELSEAPLLLLDTGFGFRRAFDAACRLARFEPRIRYESRSPHTLLALAEAGQGVAVIPSALRTDRYALRIYGLSYRRKPLQQALTIISDKRRHLPPFADAFCTMWLQHVADTLPMSRPGDVTRPRLS
jgi:DNA-binding transcriptional LysR family regulator